MLVKPSVQPGRADAALCGYEYSGLPKILNLPEFSRGKQPRQPVRVLRETEVSALIDGGNNVGMLALPTAREPLILDIGTSAFMMTDLRFRERLGQLLPEGVAIDPTGKPTRDPLQARLGALLSFGGHKGYGLALMMQAFGVLAGSAYDPGKECGYLLIVFNPDLLLPLADFKREVSELIDRVKATPRAPGVEEIRIPSERAFRERAQRLREGIEIDRKVFEALQALGAT